MITAGDARHEAAAWVREVASAMPGYRAAFIAGSTASLPGASPLPPWSDTDVMVVLDGEVPVKAGKFHRNGVFLEGTWLSLQALGDASVILGRYHEAHAIAHGQALDDPTGWLASLQSNVQAGFARRMWVERRCDGVSHRIETGLAGYDPASSLARQVMGWVFPAGILAHLPLVAALRNPTVRRRYVTAKEVLEAYGHRDVYHDLLEVLGCACLERAQVKRHLQHLAGAFDAAARAGETPFPFASDITTGARPIALDGSAALVEQGLHREAVFWIVVTWCRALLILEHTGGEAAVRPWLGQFTALLANLGIGGAPGLPARVAAARALLPRIQAVARDIVDRNPSVRP